jgi:hypothetical protein
VFNAGESPGEVWQCLDVLTSYTPWARGGTYHRAFKSFDSFKNVMGPAGEGRAWHHIVEQRRSNVERFGPEAIHNTENVLAIDKSTHDAISAYYSSKSRDVGGMVVREWLREKTYEEQRIFGLMVLKRFGVIP